MLQMESDPLHKFMLPFVFGHGMSSILDINYTLQISFSEAAVGTIYMIIATANTI